MSYAIPVPTPFGIDIAIEDDPGDREVQPYDRFLAYSRGVIHVGANIAQEAVLTARGFEVLEACEMASRPDLGACYEVIYAR